MVLITRRVPRTPKIPKATSGKLLLSKMPYVKMKGLIINHREYVKQFWPNEGITTLQIRNMYDRLIETPGKTGEDKVPDAVKEAPKTNGQVNGAIIKHDEMTTREEKPAIEETTTKTEQSTVKEEMTAREAE